MKSIAVYCGSSPGNDPVITAQTYELGKALAMQNITMVYGGAKVGLMGTVTQGVLDHDGNVIGVIPEFLKRKEIVHEGIQQLYTTKTMAERRAKMIEMSEGFIALPGGFGTMEELFEVITALQLSQIKHPVAVLNSNGYYDHLIALLQTMQSKNLLKPENYELLIVEDNVSTLLKRMHEFVPKNTPKWMK